MKVYKYLIVAAILAGCCCAVSSVRAGDEPEDVINYAYSSWIGSGFYKIGDRTVYLLRGPFSYTLREADSEKWGLELLLPVTVGFHDNADENIGTLTFVPGLRLNYPVLDNWWLKPFGQFGFGKDFSGSDIAWIYGVGIKSLATFDLKTSELDFGTAFTWADQNQSGGGSDSGFSMIEIGFNSRWPTSLTALDRKSDLNLYFLSNSIHFAIKFIPQTVEQVLQQCESYAAENRIVCLFGISTASGCERPV